MKSKKGLARRPEGTSLFTTAVWGLFALCLLLTACGSKATPEEAAAEAALSYYQRILEGYPDGLQAAKASDGNVPGDFRQQLLKTYRQYARDMQRQHGGLKAVSISPNVGRRDSVRRADGQWQQVTYAFLLLSFNDSTQEEVSVPMVLRDGEWLLK